MKIIICRATLHHIPQPNLEQHDADFCCIVELLKKDFLVQAAKMGIFLDSHTRNIIEGAAIENAIRRNYYGAIYVSNGSVDTFLRMFSAIGSVKQNIKRCPDCLEYFVSNPAEWYKHILKHVVDKKERFREESFDYYFGPD